MDGEQQGEGVVADDRSGGPSGGPPPPRAEVHPGAAVGLAPGTRYRCDGCGNLTRFDVEVVERSRRFWHVSVSGVGRVEEQDVAEQEVVAVVCRWCGSADRVAVAPAPAGEA
jgi:hypothetical protein